MSASKERNVSDGSSDWDLFLGKESEQYCLANAKGPDGISSEELFGLIPCFVHFVVMISPNLVVVCPKFSSRFETLDLACG
jgi:hypothetical protein